MNDMRKILSDFSIGKYRVLKLDGVKPMKNYSAYRIDGVVFDVVPIYDAADCIAIKSSDSFSGKTVEFI